MSSIIIDFFIFFLLYILLVCRIYCRVVLIIKDGESCCHVFRLEMYRTGFVLLRKSFSFVAKWQRYLCFFRDNFARIATVTHFTRPRPAGSKLVLNDSSRGRRYFCYFCRCCCTLFGGNFCRVICIDREFVTLAKKFANFNEFSEIKKIRKNSYKKSLNVRVGVAFQWNSLLI